MSPLSIRNILDSTEGISSTWFKLLTVVNLLVLGGGYITIQVTGSGMTGDSALFHLGGWYLADGGIPYVDFWDINPPFPFFITAILSLPLQWLPIQNEMQTLLYLANAVSAAVVMTTSLLTALIADRIFDDGLASLTAGLGIYLLPSLYVLPATGIRPKYFLLLFGMAGLYSYLRERPWLTGLFVALACTTHQAGLLYLLLATGVTGYRDGIVPAGKIIGTAAGVAVVLLVPFLYWNAVSTMIVQAVFVPLIVDIGSVSWVYYLVRFAETLGYSLVVIPIAIFGWWKVASRTDPTTVWIPLGAGMFVGYNIFLDMHGGPDVWMFIVFVSLGLAAIVADSSLGHSLLILNGTVIIGVIMLFFAYLNTNPPLYGIFDVLYSFIPTPEPLQATPPSDLPSMTERHWNQTVGDTCHWRLSDTEIVWIEQTDGNYHESDCRESLSVIWDRR